MRAKPGDSGEGGGKDLRSAAVLRPELGALCIRHGPLSPEYLLGPRTHSGLAAGGSS